MNSQATLFYRGQSALERSFRDFSEFAIFLSVNGPSTRDRAFFFFLLPIFFVVFFFFLFDRSSSFFIVLLYSSTFFIFLLPSSSFFLFLLRCSPFFFVVLFRLFLSSFSLFMPFRVM